MHKIKATDRATNRLRQQAASLDKECESNQDAIAGLADLIALLQEDYAQRKRQLEAQIAEWKKRTEMAKSDAAELRRIADEIDKKK